MREVWKPQPKQARFMARPEYEVLYGGAAGGEVRRAAVRGAAAGAHSPLPGADSAQDVSAAVGAHRPEQGDLPGGLSRARYNGTEHFWAFLPGRRFISGPCSM